MTTVAEVYLWKSRVGIVALEDGSDVALFEYDPDFAQSGIQVSPITMPLGRRVFSFPGLNRESFHGLPGMLADSLPDAFGNAVIDRWLAGQGRTPASLNAVERLCYTGSRGMGALEYVPALGPQASEQDVVDVDALADLAERILREREAFRVNDNEEDAMQQIIRVGTSAGGARAKAVVAWNETTGEIRSGQVDAGPGYGQWIVKFDGLTSNRDRESSDAPGYTRIEYAYYLMARACGIEMSECRLHERGERRHFMTRRFDRDAQSNAKIHMQTLAGLAHLDYMDPSSHSYEDAVRIMRMLGLGQDEVDQLFRRMVFNVMARNQDDHVKNISFLMDRRGVWRLAPAYDMTYAYNPHGKWTGVHQMSVNGKRAEIEKDDLIAAADGMSVGRRKAQSIISCVRDSVADWESFAAKADVGERDMLAVKRAFVEL